MVFLGKVAASLAFSALVGTALAHPGEKRDLGKIKRELALRNIVASQNRRALDTCLGSANDRALKQRAVARRNTKVKALRQKRGISTDKPLRIRDEEDLEGYSELSHESTESYDLDTDPSTLFAQNATCVIVPEVTIGPYWVAGELIREDISEDQAGIPIHVDIQFVDVNSCSGVSDLLVDMWHCNATGVYSGVSATGQGGLDSTFLRGIQESDSDGVVQFDTIYPGHYTGRTNHIHIKTTADATVYDNGTMADDGTTMHIGQFFFDQDLTTVVEATSPYSSNTQELTENVNDDIAASEATDEYDPFLSYIYLGDSISDGLLMWITVGIDTTADYSDQVSAAAHYYESGGVDTSSDNPVGGGGDGGMGGGPGGEFNGTMPSGTPGGSTTVSASTETAVLTSTSTVADETTTSTATGDAVSTTASSGAGRSCRVPGRRRY